MQTINLDKKTIKKDLQFKQAGFTYLEKSLSPALCKRFLSQIQQKLAALIETHHCTDSEYYLSVNRWPATTILADDSLSELITQIQPLVRNTINLPLVPYEIDILYKSSIANLATPCHQDIAYAFKQPYFASTWIALTDVGLQDSPLQFIPGSHHFPVYPAIDFWQPGFIDEFRESAPWQCYAKALPALCGDAILFSSKIWHASLAHSSLNPRLTIVIRWGYENILYPHVPLPQISSFGMWNCGEYTAALLKEGFEIITQQKQPNFVALIQAWQHLIKHGKVPFPCVKEQALPALEHLRILHEAYSHYNGSDGQGTVYAKVWHALLKNLGIYLGRPT